MQLLSWRLIDQWDLSCVLRGPRAVSFLSEVDRSDPQLLMARVTGDCRHGNERLAREHPRNR